VAKWLANDDDDSAIPTFASRLHPVLAPEGLAGEPEPEDASTVVSESVSPADAVTAASADSTVTQVISDPPPQRFRFIGCLKSWNTRGGGGCRFVVFFGSSEFGRSRGVW
jgi:hypothetical protein